MQVPGFLQLFDLAKSKVKLTIVFEVVDDAEDTVESRGYLKPVNIWFLFAEKNPSKQLDAKDFYKAEHVTFVPGITKQTVLDARRFGWLNFKADGAYLHVLAEPAEGWTSHYEARQYHLQVFLGRQYNIAVSLRPVDASSKVATNANQDSKSAKPREGFKL